MYILKSFEIEGFWGEYDIKKELNPDVNIFIGRNGTGKTTLINILQAALTIDLPLLENEQFSKINLHLVSGKKTRKITIIKGEEHHHEILEYQVGTRKFSIPLMLERELAHRRRRYPMYMLEGLEQLKSYMGDVNVSWLSVHRGIMEEPDERFQRPSWSPIESPVDRRLDTLTERFLIYQLKLESKARECSAEFQRNVLLSMLYDRTLDSLGEINVPGLNVEKEKEGLAPAFEEFGISAADYEPKLNKHFKTIEQQLKKVQRLEEAREKKEKHPISLDDFLAIPLLKRTKHIVDLSRKAEEEKREIFKKRGEFLTLLHSFAKDKEFALGSGGELIVKIISSEKELSIKQLSSGEKQLLILLTETLLQEDTPFIFIADEPELSLHIEWQEKLLGAIRKMNNNAQLIMATHSPEIVAEFNNSTFDMGELFHDHTTSHK